MSEENIDSLNDENLESSLADQQTQIEDIRESTTTQTSEQIERIRRPQESQAKLPNLTSETRRGRVNPNIKCPSCNRLLNGRPNSCPHCDSKVSWVDGFPCQLGMEPELEDKIAELKQLTNGLPNKCPKCLRPRPGTRPISDNSADYASRWAKTMSKHDRCPQCYEMRVERKELIRDQRRLILKSIYEWFRQLLTRLVIALASLALIYKMIEKLAQ